VGEKLGWHQVGDFVVGQKTTHPNLPIIELIRCTCGLYYEGRLALSESPDLAGEP
jgi:hypothetical protein